MQKYIKNDLSGTPQYFDDAVVVSDWIDLNEYRLMTNEEIIKHETNPNTDYHVWNGSAWIDQRTQEEIAVYERSLLQKLSKRQFSLYLYDNDMYDQVMQAIEENPRFKIEYDTVSEIERLSPTVTEMSNLLGWTNEQVDEMWNKALVL